MHQDFASHMYTHGLEGQEGLDYNVDLFAHMAFEGGICAYAYVPKPFVLVQMKINGYVNN